MKRDAGNGGSFGFKKVFVALIFIFEVILIFTFFDYLIHGLSQEYSVPAQYFINKIIYGTIIGFITYLFVRKKPVLKKSFILSAIVSILLQTGYYLQGYSLNFVLLFLAIHFVILFTVSYLGMRIAKM